MTKYTIVLHLGRMSASVCGKIWDKDILAYVLNKKGVDLYNEEKKEQLEDEVLSAWTLSMF